MNISSCEDKLLFARWIQPSLVVNLAYQIISSIHRVVTSTYSVFNLMKEVVIIILRYMIFWMALVWLRKEKKLLRCWNIYIQAKSSWLLLIKKSFITETLNDVFNWSQFTFPLSIVRAFFHAVSTALSTVSTLATRDKQFVLQKYTRQKHTSVTWYPMMYANGRKLE